MGVCFVSRNRLGGPAQLLLGRVIREDGPYPRLFGPDSTKCQFGESYSITLFEMIRDGHLWPVDNQGGNECIANWHNVFPAVATGGRCD